MNKHTLKELRSLFIGKEIGRGCARRVYSCRQDSEAVIKIEGNGGSFQNVHEWELWNELVNTKAAKWLAPCIAISPCGTILLQKRVRPVRTEEMPDNMPAFLTDFKTSNYGKYNGRIVCCDYGTTIFQGNWTRLRKVKTWY